MYIAEENDVSARENLLLLIYTSTFYIFYASRRDFLSGKVRSLSHGDILPLEARQPVSSEPCTKQRNGYFGRTFLGNNSYHGDWHGGWGQACCRPAVGGARNCHLKGCRNGVGQRGVILDPVSADAI